MRIAIVGNRDFPQEARGLIYDFIQSLPDDTVVISGGAPGVDKCAEVWAKGRGLATEIYPANWEQYGKSAGMIRNREMITACDRVTAFWNGKSRGTLNSINLGKQMRKPTEVMYPSGEVERYNQFCVNLS